VFAISGATVFADQAAKSKPISPYCPWSLIGRIARFTATNLAETGAALATIDGIDNGQQAQRSGASLAITVAKPQIALFGHRACAQHCIFPKRSCRLNGSTEQSSLQRSKCYADSNIMGRCGSEPCRHARITAGQPGDRPNIHLTPNLRGIGWFSQPVLAGQR
jgi:hypothetical protein